MASVIDGLTYEQATARMESDEAFLAAFNREVEEVRALELERERKEFAAARPARLRACGVPEKYVSALITGSLQKLPSLQAVEEFYASQDTLCVLASRPGLGKTTALAWCVARAEEEPSQGRNTAPKFVDAFTLSTRVSRYESDQMTPLERCRLLAIDDLGAEHVDKAGFWLSFIDGLVNHRYAEGRRTLISTNLPAGEFKRVFGERVADRIREVGRFVEIAGNSLRGKR